MTIRLCLFACLLFFVPSICKAQPSFREGNKFWQNYSLSQYDERLSSSAVSFPDKLRVSKNSGVDLGPVAIRLDGFQGGDDPSLDYWVRVDSLPNIHLDNQILVEVLIQHVRDFEKNNLYNQLKRSHQSIQNIGDGAFTFINKLHLTRGSQRSEIYEISGEVVFSLPVELRWMIFESADLNKEKSLPAIGVKAHISNLRFNGDSSWVEIRYQGKEETYLTTLAYDKTGKQLKKKGFSKNSVSKGWLYVYTFSGELEKLQVLVSSHSIKRKYPFTIKP